MSGSISTKAISDLIGRGDLIAAYDAAMLALAEGASDPKLRFLAVLALARMGATDQAFDLYEAQNLAADKTVDSQSIYARLLKDRALAAQAGDRPSRLREAAFAYAGIFRETGDYFPGINAASLLVLAGDRKSGEALARDILAGPALASPSNYYEHATVGEALVVLGRLADARAAFEEAARAPDSDYGSLSTTRQQVARLARALGHADATIGDLLAPLAAGSIIHFTGDMLAADPRRDRDLAEKIRQILADEEVICGYGSLSCGADILFAEGLLERGAELHVILPSSPEVFTEVAVRPGGETWLPRFARCFEKAKSKAVVGHDAYAGDPSSFAFADEIAMGLAMVRARSLAVPVGQLGLCDDAPGNGVERTAIDMVAWQSHGGRTRTIRLEPAARLSIPARPAAETAYPPRTGKAILFADFAGFTKISEKDLPEFWDRMLGSVSRAISAHAKAIIQRNTWGDAVFLVIADPMSAARLALDVQESIMVGLSGLSSLPPTSMMRVALHYGLVFEGWDPVTERLNFFGAEVSRTARVEPITPPGNVYATAPFVSSLMLQNGAGIQCTYVGQVPLAKNYGKERLFRLSRPNDMDDAIPG